MDDGVVVQILFCSIEKDWTGAREVVQWADWLLQKHKDLVWIPNVSQAWWCTSVDLVLVREIKAGGT